MVIATAGTVLGIDVGYSLTRKTTGFCALAWDESMIGWRCANAGSDEAGRLNSLAQVLPNGQRRVLAVGLDGPLRPELAEDITQYRSAESWLSGGSFQKRGKPGQTNAGSGRQLHQEATKLAHFALEQLEVEIATTPLVHMRAVVEAFPNLFLGVLCDEAAYPARPTRHRKWTDTLYLLVQNKLADLLADLLPGRTITSAWHITDHEEIAALVCALTALCVVAGRYTAVGSPTDGYIILPPTSFWGSGRDNLLPWAERELQAAHHRVTTRFPHANYRVW